MKRTVRRNLNDLPYGLHDRHITGICVCENELIFRFAEGFDLNIADGARVQGEIHFHDVDWDFCYAYVLNFYKNEGSFRGRKQFLADFAAENHTLDFEIVDESYGYNASRFSGYLLTGAKRRECTLEVYHLGGMEYITEE